MKVEMIVFDDDGGVRDHLEISEKDCTNFECFVGHGIDAVARSARAKCESIRDVRENKADG